MNLDNSVDPDKCKPYVVRIYILNLLWRFTFYFGFPKDYSANIFFIHTFVLRKCVMFLTRSYQKRHQKERPQHRLFPLRYAYFKFVCMWVCMDVCVCVCVCFGHVIIGADDLTMCCVR